MTPQERKSGAAHDRFDAANARPQHALDPDAVRSSELLRRIVANLPAVVYRCGLDADRTVEFMSLGCRTLTGFEAGDLVANRVTSYAGLVHPEDLTRVQEVVKAAVRSGRPFEVTYRIRRVDGREAAVRENGYAVRGASGDVEAVEGLITALNGPTDRELERLALDVAHDLNNALGTIKTTAELGQLEARDHSLIADLGEIIAAATRASTFVDRLRRGFAVRPNSNRPTE
jgi:signal transduction histidine kinase